jgi:hypothetical protein
VLRGKLKRRLEIRYVESQANAADNVNPMRAHAFLSARSNIFGGPNEFP